MMYYIWLEFCIHQPEPLLKYHLNGRPRCSQYIREKYKAAGYCICCGETHYVTLLPGAAVQPCHSSVCFITAGVARTIPVTMCLLTAW